MVDEPAFRVIHGTPTAEEVAAIVGVLRARQLHQTAPASPPPMSRWRASVAPRSGRLPRPAPGAWASTS
jgi:hypothetical protein